MGDRIGWRQLPKMRIGGTAAAVGMVVSLLASVGTASNANATEKGPSYAGVAELPPPVLFVVPGEQPVTVHRKTANLCGSATPVAMDSPIRMFMGQNSSIHMTTSAPKGRGFQWVGSRSSFRAGTPAPWLDCDPVFESNSLDPDPGNFNQRGFMQALYFKPGAERDSVYGFAHQDFIAQRIPETSTCYYEVEGVAYNLNHRCWYSAVSHWRSTVPDQLRHLAFAPTTQTSNIAIYPHVRYPDHADTPKSGWIGYGTPSNIFRGRLNDGSLEGGLYMFVRASAPYGGQQSGTCLFRTDDPANRLGWRAYSPSTGEFDRQMVNPYGPGTNQPCEVISTLPNVPIRSVSWHRPSRHYIAIMRTTAGGVVYATSRDMFTWNPPRTLYGVEAWEADYPSLIDLEGGDEGDPNFDRIYDTGQLWLYFRKKGSADLDDPETDIMKWRVKIGGIDPNTGKEYGPDLSGPE